MYNRYIPNGTAYTRVVEEDAPPFRAAGPTPPPTEPPHTAPPSQDARPRQERQNQQPPPIWGAAPGAVKKPTWLSDLLKSFKLDDLDTGDILLLLIILFIFIDGDDLELVITLGLLLLFGLGGKDKKKAEP